MQADRLWNNVQSKGILHTWLTCTYSCNIMLCNRSENQPTEHIQILTLFHVITTEPQGMIS